MVNYGENFYKSNDEKEDIHGLFMFRAKNRLIINAMHMCTDNKINFTYDIAENFDKSYKTIYIVERKLDKKNDNDYCIKIKLIIALSCKKCNSVIQAITNKSFFYNTETYDENSKKISVFENKEDTLNFFKDILDNATSTQSYMGKITKKGALSIINKQIKSSSVMTLYDLFPYKAKCGKLEAIHPAKGVSRVITNDSTALIPGVARASINHMSTSMIYKTSSCVFYDKENGKITLSNTYILINKYNGKRESKTEKIIIMLEKGIAYFRTNLPHFLKKNRHTKKSKRVKLLNLTYSFISSGEAELKDFKDDNFINLAKAAFIDYKESKGIKIYKDIKSFEDLFLAVKFGNFGLENKNMLVPYIETHMSLRGTGHIKDKYILLKNFRKIDQSCDINTKYLKSIGVEFGKKSSDVSFFLAHNIVKDSNLANLIIEKSNINKNINYSYAHSKLSLMCEVLYYINYISKEFGIESIVLINRFITKDCFDSYSLNSIHLELVDSCSMYKQEKKFIKKNNIKFKFNIKDLKKTHDELVLIQIEHEMIKKDNLKYIEYHKSEKKLNYSGETLNFELAESNIDLVKAGRVMKICVGNYADRALLRETTVIIAKDKDSFPIICVEIKDGKLIQFKMKLNDSFYNCRRSCCGSTIIERCEENGYMDDIYNFLVNLSKTTKTTHCFDIAGLLESTDEKYSKYILEINANEEALKMNVAENDVAATMANNEQRIVAPF